MDYTKFYDKVLGGWIGKCAGGILGAPIEGFKCFNEIPYSDKLFDTNFANDDLDLQILWLDMLLKKGNGVRESDFKTHWLTHVDFPWCEYGIATRNLKLGLDLPDSGRHNNKYWKSGMGSPIRSEIWGMVNPGMPKMAAFYAEIDSSLDHYGFSVHAEQYLSACASIAFVENDIKTILSLGLKYIPEDSDCRYMIEEVIKWSKAYKFEIVAGKIKSKYGDADFTNAPMNVAFIILSLLHANNNFDFVIDALHLGHDSDCIVATAGALLGIVLGSKKIPEAWKERVGNEILVSPEIVGIYCPKTITELSELTCKAAFHFAEESKNTHLAIKSPFDSLIITPKDYALHAEVKILPKPNLSKDGELLVFYENLSTLSQEVRITLQSSVFETKEVSFTAATRSKKTVDINLNIAISDFKTLETSLHYNLELHINDRPKIVLKKGIPYYGSWFMLGPFIEDDSSLIGQNKKYPDHGLPSLPSMQYMNHDAIKSEHKFLDPLSLREWISQKSIFDQGFHASVVYPTSMKMNLNEYFYGKGERTIYLYSEIESPLEEKKWLVIGSTGQLTIWHNENESYTSKEAKRRWPMAHMLELNLSKGNNRILVRVDIALDDFDFEIGLKEHKNKHPHQSQWETKLQFNVSHNI